MPKGIKGFIKGHKHSEDTKRKIGLSNKKPITHGMSHHRLYQIWKSMMTRCYSERDHNYHNYGGRGIKVCKRWHSIENFIIDNNEIYYEGGNLDRINNNKGYSTKNCHWVNHRENTWNTRTNRMIEYRGEKKPLSKWCYELGLEVGTVWSRLKRGDEVERAFRKVTT